MQEQSIQHSWMNTTRAPGASVEWYYSHVQLVPLSGLLEDRGPPDDRICLDLHISIIRVRA